MKIVAELMAVSTRASPKSAGKNFVDPDTHPSGFQLLHIDQSLLWLSEDPEDLLGIRKEYFFQFREEYPSYVSPSSLSKSQAVK